MLAGGFTCLFVTALQGFCYPFLPGISCLHVGGQIEKKTIEILLQVQSMEMFQLSTFYSPNCFKFLLLNKITLEQHFIYTIAHIKNVSVIVHSLTMHHFFLSFHIWFHNYAQTKQLNSIMTFTLPIRPAPYCTTITVYLLSIFLSLQCITSKRCYYLTSTSQFYQLQLYC